MNKHWIISERLVLHLAPCVIHTMNKTHRFETCSKGSHDHSAKAQETCRSACQPQTTTASERFSQLLSSTAQEGKDTTSPSLATRVASNDEAADIVWAQCMLVTVVMTKRWGLPQDAWVSMCSNPLTSSKGSIVDIVLQGRCNDDEWRCMCSLLANTRLQLTPKTSAMQFKDDHIGSPQSEFITSAVYVLPGSCTKFSMEALYKAKPSSFEHRHAHGHGVWGQHQLPGRTDWAPPSPGHATTHCSWKAKTFAQPNLKLGSHTYLMDNSESDKATLQQWNVCSRLLYNPQGRREVCMCLYTPECLTPSPVGIIIYLTVKSFTTNDKIETRPTQYHCKFISHSARGPFLWAVGQFMHQPRL